MDYKMKIIINKNLCKDEIPKLLLDCSSSVYKKLKNHLFISLKWRLSGQAKIVLKAETEEIEKIIKIVKDKNIVFENIETKIIIIGPTLEDIASDLKLL